MQNLNEPPGRPHTPETNEMKQATANVAQDRQEAVESAFEDAAKAAASQASAAKASVADEMSGVASALRTASKELREGSPQERTFGQIAESLADASDALRDKDLGTMMRDVTAFARANPLVFLGGAALVGFAATRFTKASEDAGKVAQSRGASGTPVVGGPS